MGPLGRAYWKKGEGFHHMTGLEIKKGKTLKSKKFASKRKGASGAKGTINLRPQPPIQPVGEAAKGRGRKA